MTECGIDDAVGRNAEDQFPRIDAWKQLDSASKRSLMRYQFEIPSSHLSFLVSVARLRLHRRHIAPESADECCADRSLWS